MKVKREVRICDICSGDGVDELSVAKYKCSVCDKDLCNDCCEKYYINFENGDNTQTIEIDCCGNCIKTFRIDEKKDKKFLKEITTKSTNYFKQKVMLKEIEK